MGKSNLSFEISHKYSEVYFQLLHTKCVMYRLDIPTAIASWGCVVRSILSKTERMHLKINFISCYITTNIVEII